MFSEFLGRRDQSSESGETKKGLESRLSLQRAIGAVVKWDRYREANKYVIPYFYQEKLKNLIMIKVLYGPPHQILSNKRHKMLQNISHGFNRGHLYSVFTIRINSVILPNNLV